MSDILVTYKQQNKYDKYFALTTMEQRSIDTLTTNFIQELITDKGSNVFDRDYGTDFISDIGEQVNIHKVRYIIDNSLSEIKKKYSIVSINTSNVNFNVSDGFLEIHLSIEFEDVAVEKHFNFIYNGIFTEKMILEVD